MSRGMWGKISTPTIEEGGSTAFLNPAVLGQALEQVADAIMITDARAQIVYANRACEQLFGTPSSSMLGKPPASFGDRSADPAFYRDMWMTAQRGEVWRGDLRVRRPDGGWRNTEAAISPLRAEDGGITGYLASLRDVTEVRDLERELVEAQKMEAVGRLASGIAHDFNNLLTAVMGYADLARSLPAGPPLSEALREIQASTNRAAALSRQLLAFSRRQLAHPRVIDLDAVVSSLRGLLQRLAGDSVEVIVRRSGDLWPVEMDPGQLEQILTNLVVNARDAMASGGTVVVETGNVELGPDYTRSRVGSKPGPHVMLAVSDTGSGIDPEVVPHIFEPFFTTKEHGKGTGLGLATVYGIVKQNAGNVWVYSEPHRGTVFKVYLPRSDKSVDWAPSADAPSPERAAGGDETILVVEDEPAVRALSVRVLESAGYRVMGEGDPKAALAMCACGEGPVHLLLADLVLPGMSGRDFADLMAQNQRTAPRVLYMSGYTYDAAVHHGRLDPGVHFLEKPFTPDGLLRKVREVLDRPPDGQLQMPV